MKTGQFVIVRTDRAGVHFGKLASRKGQEVVLKETRRLWYWHAAKSFSLTGVATHGLQTDSKISETIPEITLLDAIEVIPCTATAKKSIAELPAGKQ